MENETLALLGEMSTAVAHSLRNPLASPSTLGVEAGAGLAIALALAGLILSEAAARRVRSLSGS